jgi:hypothetical protein
MHTWIHLKRCNLTQRYRLYYTDWSFLDAAHGLPPRERSRETEFGVTRASSSTKKVVRLLKKKLLVC